MKKYINTGNTNKRTVELIKGHRDGRRGPRDGYIVSLEQIGLQNRFDLRNKSMNSDLDRVVSYTDREQAVFEFKETIQAFCEAGYNVDCVVDTKRPVGITDPDDTYRYIQANLLRTQHSSSIPYRCYNVSDSTYERADAGPLTEDDIKAVSRSMGQIHKVTGQVGDMQVSVHIEVDSSD